MAAARRFKGAVIMTNSYGQEAVSVRGAAKILGLSHTRVATFVNEGRLSAERMPGIALMMIPLQEVKKFRSNKTGRPPRTVRAFSA